ncbi:MAG: hypothetical protein ABIS26_02500, partial [Candidatus Paceibacterota bacterium]
MNSSTKKLHETVITRAFFLLSFLIVVFLIFSPLFSYRAEATAGVPKIINFQGRLMDSSGNLLGSSSGTNYCYRFSLWDVSTGGTRNPNQVWPSSFAVPTTMTILTRSGVFDASIGGAGGDTLDFNFQSNDTVYVDVEVAAQVASSCVGVTFETLDPRPQIVSAGYAINSGTLAGLTQTTAATVSTIVARDANANVNVNNALQGYTTTVTAAGTTTLTVASTQQQYFTGSTTQTVTLPVTSTLVLGQTYIITNNSTGLVTVNSSGGNAVIILAGGTSAVLTTILTSGTTAASWNATYLGTGITSGKKLSATNSLTFSGTDGSTLDIGTGGTLGTAAYTAASAYEVPLTFSTGLTRSVNTITNNLSVGVSGGQSVIGGTGVTDVLSLKGTTGNGTLTSAAIQAVVGNNGATTALTILNNGNVGIGITGPTAKLHITQSVTATGALTGIVYTGAVNTNQTLSTEIPSLTLTTAGREWATGALTMQREVLITAPTYSFVGASTITDAATFAIAGAPIKSTNATITNTHGLLIQAGAVSTATNSYGLTVNAQTGATNNYAAAFLGGNVGIGTAAPTKKLEIAYGTTFDGGYGVTTGPVVTGDSAGGEASLGYGISKSSSTYGLVTGAMRNVVTSGAGYVGMELGTTSNFPLRFITNNTCSGSGCTSNTHGEQMRITAAGNVGVGTTAPLTKLDLAGNFRTTGKATAVLTGTIDPAASTAVVGVGTLFTTELVVGDRITVTGETRTVTAITDNTNLTVDVAFSNNANDTTPDALYAL